jgi:hypothetical protein
MVTQKKRSNVKSGPAATVAVMQGADRKALLEKIRERVQDVDELVGSAHDAANDAENALAHALNLMTDVTDLLSKLEELVEGKP